MEPILEGPVRLDVVEIVLVSEVDSLSEGELRARASAVSLPTTRPTSQLPVVRSDN